MAGVVPSDRERIELLESELRKVKEELDIYKSENSRLKECVVKMALRENELDY